MKTKKTNIIIQCRFSSTRLPGKALYPLCGIPMLVFLIRRLARGLETHSYRIILATSNTATDDPVSAWADHEGIPCIRGDLDNVLARYITTIQAFPSPINVRVTADNPLTCPQIIQDCVTLAGEKKWDYTQANGFPYGTGVDVFSDKGLFRVFELAQTSQDFEHINNVIFTQPEKFTAGHFNAPEKLSRPDLRMTIDTPEDYARMVRALSRYGHQPAWDISLIEAVRLFETETHREK